MPWKRVSAGSTRRTTAPAISINKNGRIGWNRGLQHALEDPEWVELLYDSESECVALRKVEKSREYFQVRKSKNQASWGFAALGPLNASVGVVPEKAYRRFAEEFEPGVWGISVKEMVEDAKKARGTA